MTKYRLYVDEVGNSDLGSSRDPNHRFLSLTGVIIDLKHVEEHIHPEMENLKRRHFGSHPDDPLIFHRKELVNKKPPFSSLGDPAVEESFNLGLLGLFRAWDYRAITVCLDKQRHKENYTTWRYDPYHYCLAVLLERFNFWLNRQKCQGDVMAESRGGKGDSRLKTSFERLWREGSPFVAPDQFQKSLTSRQLKVKPKTANVSGLQLADLLAHPSRCEILDEQGLLGRPLAPFTKQIIAILEEKYDSQGARKYGKKFL